MLRSAQSSLMIGGHGTRDRAPLRLRRPAGRHRHRQQLRAGGRLPRGRRRPPAHPGHHPGRPPPGAGRGRGASPQRRGRGRRPGGPPGLPGHRPGGGRAAHRGRGHRGHEGRRERPGAGRADPERAGLRGGDHRRGAGGGAGLPGRRAGPARGERPRLRHGRRQHAALPVRGAPPGGRLELPPGLPAAQQHVPPRGSAPEEGARQLRRHVRALLTARGRPAPRGGRGAGGDGRQHPEPGEDRPPAAGLPDHPGPRLRPAPGRGSRTWPPCSPTAGWSCASPCPA